MKLKIWDSGYEINPPDNFDDYLIINCLVVIIRHLYDSLLEETTKNIPNDKKRYERTRAALALVERS